MNSIIRIYAGKLKRADFYSKLLGRFRKEPLDNRFLLLLQLKGMEINPLFPLSRLGMSQVTFNTTKKNMVVTLRVLSHPAIAAYKANCYSYEVLLG